MDISPTQNVKIVDRTTEDVEKIECPYCHAVVYDGVVIVCPHLVLTTNTDSITIYDEKLAARVTADEMSLKLQQAVVCLTSPGVMHLIKGAYYLFRE